MRLIDADALIAEWYRVNDIDENDRGARFVGYTEIVRIINSIPTIELIRCKDCEYADLHDGEYRLCLLTGTWKKFDHFCSDGEREEDR